MKSSFFWRISSSWKDHSEQIKQFVALSTSDSKNLEQARSYIHNLDLEKYIKEIDDTIDLTLWLPKVDYPRNTQVTLFVQKYVAQSTEDMTVSHIKNIASLIHLSPDSFFSFFDNFFANETCVAKFQSGLLSMDLHGIVNFLNKMSKNDQVDWHAEKYKIFLTAVQTAFCEAIDRVDALTALQTLLPCEFPIWKILSGFPRKVEKLYTMLSPTDCLGIFLSLDEHAKNHREWGIVLQQLLCRVLGDFTSIQITEIFSKLTLLRVPIREKVWLNVFKVAETSDRDEVVTDVLCSSVKRLDKCKNSKLRDRLKKTLQKHLSKVMNISSSGVSSKDIRLLLNYGYICKDGAKNFFSQMDFDRIMVLPDSLLDICKLMHTVEVYPRNLVSNLTALKKCSQEESIYLLNAILHSGLLVEECHIQGAVGPFAYRQFSSKKNRSISLSSGDCFVLLNALCHLDCSKYNPKLFPVANILHLTSITLSERLSLLTASIKNNKNPAVSSFFLQDVLLRAHQCNQAQLQTVFSALAALRMREAVIFTKLLRIAEEMQPTVGLALCAAHASKCLKLTPHFARTTIVESIKNLSGTTFDSFIELLKCCTKSQREYLINLAGARELLEQVDVDSISTSSLLVLANTSSLQRKKLMRMLKDRNPMKAGEVTSEEIVLSLEHAQRSADVELIFKIGGHCLDEMDERQLMRIYQCLAKSSKCPNVAFRILGRNIMKTIKCLTADEALLWLNMYVKHEIRDDAVSKLLLKKAQSRREWTSRDMEAQMKKAEAFFGVSTVRAPIRKERSTAFYSTTL